MLLCRKPSGVRQFTELPRSNYAAKYLQGGHAFHDESTSTAA